MPRTARIDLYGGRWTFWLLVALALALLVGVSATGHAGPARQGGGVADLLRGIERDLSALRAQLELIGGSEEGFGRASLREEIGPDAGPGLGDGSRVFRLRSMETMVRSLERRVDQLVEVHHQAGNDRGLDLARVMSLDARSALWGVEELRFAREAHLVRAARERIGHALDEIARGARAVAALRAQAAGLPRAGAGQGA